MHYHFEALKADWKRNSSNPKGRLLVIAYRIANIVARQKQSCKPLWFLGIPILLIYQIIIEWILGMEIPAKTDIGPGLVVYHGQGLIVHSESQIGTNVTLRHNTTIGNKYLKDGSPSASPQICDNADIGANTVVIGQITIGCNSIIGAGSVVVKDIPPYSIAAGNPATIINSAQTQKDKTTNNFPL